MSRQKFSPGCGGIVIFFLILMGIAAALGHAADHMDAAASLIVGAIIVGLLFMLLKKS